MSQPRYPASSSRVASTDSGTLARALDADGYAVLAGLLTPDDVLLAFEDLIEHGYAILRINSEGVAELELRGGAVFVLEREGVTRIR
jgi:hypothetical protein